MTFEDDFPTIKQHFNADFSDTALFYADNVKIIIKKCCLDKANKKAVCEQALKFGMIHSQTVKEAIDKVEAEYKKMSPKLKMKIINFTEDLELIKQELGIKE